MMHMRRFTLFLLNVYLFGSLYGLIAIGLDLPIRIPLTAILTFLAFLFAFLHAGQREGWRKAILLVVIVFATGLLFESVGVATGLVYGPYHYSDTLGPKFLNLVPFLIPLAWTFMMYPSLVIADSFASKSRTRFKRWMVVAAIGGLVMTAWDVVMDPLMVKGGNWVWEINGAFFGVPLQNYFGWWLTTFVSLMLYQAVTDRIKESPVGIPDRWVVYSYMITTVSSVTMALIVGMEGPALAGIFAILPWLIVGIMRTNPNYE
jgi:uncharacterized membrane protein